MYNVCENLTPERPWNCSELVKAQIVSPSCQIYCVQLRNESVGHHFVAITVVLTTAIIISLKNTEAAFGGPGTSSARPTYYPRADFRQSPTVGKGT